MKNDLLELADQLHDEAMDVAELAVQAEKSGRLPEAKKLFAKSFDLEHRSAMLLVNEYNFEPSRSVLFRSAACLAIKAGKFRQAEQMAAFGLSGNPPVPIDKELRNALKEALTLLEPIAVA